MKRKGEKNICGSQIGIIKSADESKKIRRKETQNVEK